MKNTISERVFSYNLFVERSFSSINYLISSLFVSSLGVNPLSLIILIKIIKNN